MEQNVSPYKRSDEVDLRELVQTIWTSRLLIISTTLVMTCIAAGYAFLSDPVYEASVQTLPPTVSDLSSYNLGTQLTGAAISGITKQVNAFASLSTGIKELKPEAAYKAFLQRLTSGAIRQQFFDQIYLPDHMARSDKVSREQLWSHLKKNLKITIPTKPGDFEAKVTIEGTDQKTIANWANSYVSLATKATQKDYLSDLASEIAVRNKGIGDQIATLRKVALITRLNQIKRLKDALNVAESIGQETPPNSGNLLTSYSGETMYLRGTKALHAELNILEKRNSDDPYIEYMPDLLKKQALLKGIDLSTERLSVATIDRAAITPEAPIKPKKGLALGLGIILGGMLGIFIALIRRKFK